MFEINRHVILALRAHTLFEVEKEYIVSDKAELVLLDEASGRRMPGVKLRGGLHQAIEEKEKINISKENRSIASITYQNLFRLFPKMSGMSGTISDAAQELWNVYHAKDQIKATIELIKATHRTGQPVLIVVTTIAETEQISSMLVREGVAHNVLNANNAFWEAGIIKEAGQKNAVTVATSMAGRGTDIKLGPEVRELGGLAVIGIGRMVNVRQERQARGRAGRQGDPGFSQFFVAMEDEVVLRYTSNRLQRKCFERGKKVHFLKSKIDGAQRLCEENAVSGRTLAQRNPLFEYQKEALESFGTLSTCINRLMMI